MPDEQGYTEGFIKEKQIFSYENYQIRIRDVA